MKKILTVVTVFLLLMIMSQSVGAHSHLQGSKPADGDVVTEPLKEIVLEFDGQIEQGSFVDVTTTEGKGIELQETIIRDQILTATVAEPLENADYQVSWSIISADGHPLEGEFVFTVNAEIPDSIDEGMEETEKITEAADGEDRADSAEPTREDMNEEETQVVEGEEESSSLPFLFSVLIVVIVAGGIFFMLKRKK